MASALSRFSKPTRTWFEEVFDQPTPAQDHAWAAISAGHHSLVVAPTGSGKTLAAFLWAIDRLASQPLPSRSTRRTRVLYISPLKALAVDVERNLRAPLAGITNAARAGGLPIPDLTVALRSGDTPANERQRFRRRPTDILITTPESLYLLLTSATRDVLRGIETVIVDEVHAVAGTKRGAHLAVSLERLDQLLDRPAQRIGLSATVRPVDAVAQFLGGSHTVEVVQPSDPKPIDLRVVVPVEDLTALDNEEPGLTANQQPQQARSIWPHVESHIVDLVASHRSTIVFANSRRLAERLSTRLNEVWSSRNPQSTQVLARAHHGSVSREQRRHIEEDLKLGLLPAVVATSSLELGIDMGAVDLVIQVEPPPSVSSGVQRVGRADHRVDGISRGVIFPKHRGDLIPTAVTVERMRSGQIEALSIPRNPLDVLAQQVVAMVAMDDWSVKDLGALLRRCAPFRELPPAVFTAVLDMLAGRYPSDAFAELRPRLVWDRDTDLLTARQGAQRVAVINGGTIPDRGLFGVFLSSTGDNATGRRVGELDEEMVYESRVGEVFALGASSWRIDDITHDRVLVSPAPGRPGRLPFWHGDTLGRPAELGAAIGRYVRALGDLEPSAAIQAVAATGLDEWATENTISYLDEQRDACGHLPDDRTIVVERFRDEIGDWRMVIHSWFGGKVNTPWSLAIAARLRHTFGVDVQIMPSDDGIVLRLPDAEAEADQFKAAIQGVLFDPEAVERAVTEALEGSALFAAKFRECAARALLLPRRRPDRRTPLWQQRQRSSQLLAVASEHPQFPIVLEALRECLQDVFDVPALKQLMRDLQQGATRIIEVETARPSPFARSLLFSYVGAFLYEGDAPLAERRAQALALDSSLLAELLGAAELRELLDSGAIEQVEAQLQRLTSNLALRDADDLADSLRVLGPMSTEQLIRRGAHPSWLDTLVTHGRVFNVTMSGEHRWAAVEDISRLRDALGLVPPSTVPTVFLEPVLNPLLDVLSRYARTHRPFTTTMAATDLCLGVAVVEPELSKLSGAGRLLAGQFIPGGAGQEWCDPEVLRRIRRRSLALLRREIEPVPPSDLGRFLPDWQSADGRLRGIDGVFDAIEQLQGAVVPASVLEHHVLPVRVSDYTPAMLDELLAAGEVRWSGHGRLAGRDGWVTLTTQPLTSALARDPDPSFTPGPIHQSLLDHLSASNACFFASLRAEVEDTAEPAVVEALWDLVWAGHVTNDTMAPLRAYRSGKARNAPPIQGRRRYLRPGRPPRPVHSRASPTAGRWSLLPPREAVATVRAHAAATALLERHGVLTRGAVSAEQYPGGFAAVYRVLAALEAAGQSRRGYFIEGLGASQFASAGAVDRLRAAGGQNAAPALVLAATDPANPYGAALPWPRRPATDEGGHLPGRKAGALVVIIDGELGLYVERGGRTLLSWVDERSAPVVANALADAVQRGWLGRISIERADGSTVLNSPLAQPLQAAGFRLTPRGLRMTPTL